METLWYLSFVVLILGNIIDGCATLHHMLHNPGAFREGSLPALWAWDLLGLVPAVIFVKLFLLSFALFGIWWFLSETRYFDPWVRIRASAFFGFFIGVTLALGGTGVLSAVALRFALIVFPPEIILAHWDALPTILWVVVMLSGGIAMGAATAVLLVLNDRRLVSEK